MTRSPSTGSPARRAFRPRRGKITGCGEVTVDTADGPRVFRARRGILLNTGTEPAIPPISGLAGTPYWTSPEAVETQQVPRVADRARRRRQWRHAHRAAAADRHWPPRRPRRAWHRCLRD